MAGKRKNRTYKILPLAIILCELFSEQKNVLNPTNETFIEICQNFDNNINPIIIISNIDIIINKIKNIIKLMELEVAKSKIDNKYNKWNLQHPNPKKENATIS